MSDVRIEQVAPVLRILLAKDERFPIVRFIGQSQQRCKCVDISLPAQPQQEEIIKTISGTLTKTKGIDEIEFVTVSPVGTFQIIPNQIVSGRVAGKVVVITGAAQGFGLEIAKDMVANGAYVVLTDINSDGVRRQAKLLENEYGRDRTLALFMDVTNVDSVRDAIHQVVVHYGGFDVFISNAGVLLAESVKTQPEKDFDLVTNVNYKGYFICVQQAVPILSLQHKVDPSYTSDIIQINSKSGLRGSERNFAYAGSKFGSIGLTQSFALELVEDGIKVNAVCPGNFFDGPLWSDPHKGLFIQYLRAGKVKGAKTVEDVRKAYESKIPMGRGCTAADVMKAIYYLIEQKYETGQALPVTGGQIMLH